MKTIPVQTSSKKIVKVRFINLQDKRKEHQPKYNLGDLVRTAAIRKIISKGDSTNWGYDSYTVTEVIHVTIS